MHTQNQERVLEVKEYETLSSFITKEEDYKISNQARFIGFQHRMKVEFLRSFIV